MLWIRPAALRVRIVLPPTDLPKALPSHSRYVFGPSTVSCVKTSLSYALPVEAAKTVAMALTPTHGSLRTDAYTPGSHRRRQRIPAFRFFGQEQSSFHPVGVLRGPPASAFLPSGAM